MCQVQVNGKAVEMMIDTGASVNLLDEATFHRIDCGNKLLEHAHSKIYSYGSDTPLPLLGTLSTTIKSSSNSGYYHPVTCCEGKHGKPPQLQHSTEACPEISQVKFRATYIQTVSQWFQPLVFTLIPGLIMLGKFEWSNTYLFTVK